MTTKKDNSEKALTYSEKDYSKEAMLDRIKFYKNQKKITFSNLKKYFNDILSIKLDKENCIKAELDRMEKLLFHENGNLKEPYKSIENGTKKINYNTGLFGITKNKDGYRIKMGSQAQRYLYYTTGLMYYNWIIKKPKSQKTYITGFDSKLSQETIESIQSQMVEKKLMKTDLEDFKAIFSEMPVKFIKPILWLIENKRGPNHGQGNKTALFVFLENMLGKGNVSNKALRKTGYFFKDNKGNFMKKVGRPNNEKICIYGFEEIIQKAKEKADQYP